ncbi:MAG: TadE/TadG family type IV pilus assembly protein [bacterium]
MEMFSYSPIQTLLKIRNPGYPQSGCEIRNRKGQSLIELSIMLPLFFFIIIILFELLLLSHNYLVLAHVASEAARFVAAGGSDDQVMDLIKSYQGHLASTALLKWKVGNGFCEIDESGVTIEPAEEDRRVGEEVQVDLDYTLAVNLGYIWTPNILVLSMPASARMPVEMDSDIGEPL